MRKKNQILMILVAGLWVWGSLTGQAICKTDENAIQKPSQPRVVALEQVGLESADNAIHYPGTVKACKQADLSFRVGGPLTRVNVKPGDRVKKGQLLMQIDPQDYKDRINVLNAQLEGALSRFKTAQLDFTRVETLFDQKVIPQADFDHTLNGRKMASAGVAQIRAQLSIARHQLEYTSLRAPYDGIIVEQKKENHEMVSPGRVVLSLHDISMLEVQVSVPENEIVKHPLKVGVPAQANFPSLGNRVFPVQLKEWSTVADPASKTFQVTFTLPMPETHRILPGMTAEVVWNGGGAKESIKTVPAKAVVTDPSGDSFVWVFDRARQTARKIKVKTGGFAGASRVIVKTGLRGNEMIVIDGMDFITENMRLAAVLKIPGNLSDN